MSLAAAIERDVSVALTEDIGSGDLTARLIPAERTAHAQIVSRVDAVACGGPWLETCFRRLDAAVQIAWSVREGERIAAGQALCAVSGNARALISAERSALNFMQTLSAVATATRAYVDAVAGTRAQIVDTRKTLPGLRVAGKYAVRMGGGSNHRMGLYDAILIKENHIAAAGGIGAVLTEAYRIAPTGTWIQIEVETAAQLREALTAGATMILLDNMNTEQLREAVKLTGDRAQLEASGGITLENVRAIAETGVDRISIGSLTKDIRAVDYSMRFDD